MAMLEELALALTTPTAPVTTSHGVLASTLFMGILPDTPDICVALLEIPGGPPEETMQPLPVAENQTLQVLVRNPSYAAGLAAARLIWLDLQRLVEVDLTGTRYHAVRAGQSPFLLERDASRRNLFSCTYTVSRKVMG